MAVENRSPSRTGYVVAAAIFLIGALIAGALIAYVAISLINVGNDMERVIIPGTSEVTLEDTGRYTVFYERQSRIDEREFDSGGDPPELDIEVTDVDSGERIPVSEGFGDVSYSFWSRSGESIASFQIDEPGSYEISVEYAGDAVDEEAVLALGEGMGTTIILVIFAALGSGAFFCGSVGVALIVAIITLIRRSRASSPSSQSPGT